MKIFKNKSVIRLYAFVTACLIILTLLLCGLNVCAEGNVDLIAYYNMSDVVFDYSQISGSYHSDITEANQDNYDYLIDENCFIAPDDSIALNKSNFPHYLLFEIQWDRYFKFTTCPDNSFIIIDDNSFTYYAPSTYFSDGHFRTGQLNGRWVTSGFAGWGYTDFNSGTKEKNGTTYNYFTQGYSSSSRGSLIVTDIPIYEASDSESFSGVDFNDSINNSAPDIEEGESAENNMYFKNFNISYSVSGLKDGNIVCYGDLNDYQKEHLDEFALTYTFNFEYYAYNPTVTGYKYDFKKNYSYQQTLSDFYSNGSSKVFTLKDIMQNINTQDVDSEYGNLYQLVSYLSNTGNNENIEYIWSKAKMKTTVFIVSANDSPSDILNSSNLHSNSFSKAYNFLDGKSSTYSDGITNNNNPYETTETGSISDQNELNNMPDGVSSSNIPSSQGDNGGSGTSVVTGDNNIVINNNPTFTNNGGSGGGSSDSGVASTFYNTFNPFKTLFSSLNGDNSVISDETADSIGANRFISVMSSTFSFIPEGMWTALTTFFIASLSILVVAVVIRVLLDLL